MKFFIIILLGFATISLAQTPAEQRKERLQPQVDAINQWVDYITLTSIITEYEMVKLCQMVNRFNKELREAKEIYGDAMDVKLDPRINRIVYLYQKPLLRDGCPYQMEGVELKKILAEVSGKDIVKVYEHFDFGVLTIAGLIMCFGIFLFRLGVSKNNDIIGWVGFIISIVLFLIIISGLSGF